MNNSTSGQDNGIPVTAFIKSTNSRGVVVVKFNQAMRVPANYSAFNESVLNITIIPGEGQDTAKLGFTWTVTEFSETDM